MLLLSLPEDSVDVVDADVDDVGDVDVDVGMGMKKLNGEGQVNHTLGLRIDLLSPVETPTCKSGMNPTPFPKGTPAKINKVGK